MNKVCARHDSLAYQIEFPSPVYTAAIMGSREDVCVGVGGGKRFGMPNIVIAVEQVQPKDPKKVWNVCSWLDLGDDIPWAGAKLPMTFRGEGGGIDKQYLAMSHLDAISILEYEKNADFDPAKLAEEQAQPQEKLGKRDSPPPPKNGPVFLRRAARLALTTDEENPEKKVIAIVRSAQQPEYLSDQLFFVCQDDSSVVMFRLKKRRTGAAAPVKKAVVKTEENADEEEPSSPPAVDHDSYAYEVYSHTIPSNELRMGNAHPTDMDARETPSGVVLMIVCDDKKVRVALLPQVWHCLKVCKSPEEAAEEMAEAKAAMLVGIHSAKKADATAAGGEDSGKASVARRPSTLKAPLAVVVRSLLVLTPEDLTIPFAVMRSTLRVGMLMDEEVKEGNNNREDGKGKDGTTTTPAVKTEEEKKDGSEEDEGIIVLIMAYDSKNGSTNAVMSRITIVDKCLLSLQDAPSVAPVCKGAVTNLMPLYNTKDMPCITTSGDNYRPMPESWLATTVEGTIVELVQQQNNHNSNAKKGAAAASSSSLYYPTYATAHQRPHKPKRNPPHLEPVHNEPISSAAVSLRSGLLVTVDIAQKARLSRMDLPTMINSSNEGYAAMDGKKKSKGPSSSPSNGIAKAISLSDGIPLLFPLKSAGGGVGASSAVGLLATVFGPLMVVAMGVLCVLIAVAPQLVPQEVMVLLGGFINVGGGGGEHAPLVMNN